MNDVVPDADNEFVAVEFFDEVAATLAELDALTLPETVDDTLVRGLGE